MVRITLVVLLALAVAAEDQPRLAYNVEGVTAHGSTPRIWTSSGNTTWFTALTARGKRELFRTDGTAEGTVQLTFGKGSPYPNHDQSYNSGAFVGVVNGKLVYGGNDDFYGGLYALDMKGGTPVLLEDLKSQDLANGAVLDGWLYFTARNWRRDEDRMWRTDGTPEGTQELDVLLGYSESRLYLAGGRIFFFGRTATGSGLHVTRGTRATTTLVHPFDAWRMSSSLVPFHVRTVGDRVVFWMTPSPSELWGTDGTPEGTKLLSDFTAYRPLGILGGRLFFHGPGQLLWSTDGTPEGTRETGLVTGTGVYSIQGGTVLGEEMFFYVDRDNVMTLYVTGGTPETTRALLTGTRVSLPASGLVAGGVYYFMYDDGIHGAELWRTDGRTAPRMVTDLNPGKASGIAYELVAVGHSDGTVLLAGTHRDSGTEPWVTDGTAEGTHLLINVAAEDFTSYSGRPERLQASGSRVFFTASTNDGAVVGVSDGLRTTTTPMEGLPAAMAMASRGRYFFSSAGAFFVTDGMSITQLHDSWATPHRVPGGIVFSRRVSNGGISLGDEIVFSDGTLSGTRVIRGVTPEPSHYWIGTAGDRVWLHDGKRFFFTDGATPVEIAPAELAGGYLADAIRAGAVDYLIESDSASGAVRVWRSDGTSAGTRILLATSGGAGQYGYFVGATERRAYFVVNREFFVSDGTPEGTVGLPVTPPYCRSQGVLGEVLLFNGGRSLWRTDGTAAGTAKLMTFPDDDCFELVAHGGRVYFDAEDAEHGQELWQSDGTVEGTRLAADIRPGAESSWPGMLTAAGDRLFFVAETEVGRELWVLGGPEGAKRRAMRR